MRQRRPSEKLSTGGDPERAERHPVASGPAAALEYLTPSAQGFARAARAPDRLTPAHIRILQQSIGNARVGRLLQRSPVETGGGTFTDDLFEDVDRDGSVGLNVVLGFEPNDRVDATKIGLTQSVRTEEGGSAAVMGATKRQRTVAGGEAEGFAIDRFEGQNNPIYGAQILGFGEGIADTATSDRPGRPVHPADAAAQYRLGWRFQRDGTIERQSAQLADTPRLPKPPPGLTASQRFETTALALEGADKDRYYGSVSWGWEIDAAGQFTSHPLKLEGGGAPTAKFVESARLWNAFQYSATLTPPDPAGCSTTTVPLRVTVGDNDLELPAGVRLTFAADPDLSRERLLATLPDAIEIVGIDTNIDFVAYVPFALLGTDDRLSADVQVTGARGKQKPFTIAKGTLVQRFGRPVGNKVVVKVISGALKDLDPELRLAWVDAEKLGRKTASLPIP